jgi:DNA-binding MarR family transcriptional regulator
MDYTLLKELLSYTEEYQKLHHGHKIEDFTIWLNNQLFTSKIKTSLLNHNDLQLAFKLLHLNKALKKQAKSILAESNLSSLDEYSFLLHLNHQESFRKMEIIEIHNLEAPTGIEIIKRLLKNDLIEEFPDKDDKRAKRIKITNTGKSHLLTIKQKIDQVFSAFEEPLSLNEKIQMSGLLDKLIH